TRFSRDWSSDVCSSDLERDAFVIAQGLVLAEPLGHLPAHRCPTERDALLGQRGGGPIRTFGAVLLAGGEQQGGREQRDRDAEDLHLDRQDERSSRLSDRCSIYRA